MFRTARPLGSVICEEMGLKPLENDIDEDADC
jgi:hypothetical protein